MAIHTHALWFRLLRGTLIVLAVLILLCGLFAGWLLGTASGAKWLVGTALPYAQDNMPETLQLEIEGIEASTLAHIRIKSLTLADRQGVWFEAESLALHWHPSALLRRVLHAKEITAARIHFLRPPEGESEPERSLQDSVEDVTNFLEQLPETLQDMTLPAIRVDRIQVQELALDSGIVDTPSRFTFSGAMDLTIRPAQLALELHSLEGVETEATARIRGTKQDAKLNFHWQEAAGGILANILQLASPAASTLTASSTLQGEVLATTVHATTGDAALAHAVIRVPMEDSARIDWQLEILQPQLLRPLADFPTTITAEGELTEDSVHIITHTERYAPAGETSLTQLVAEAMLRLDEGSPPYALDATLRAAQPLGAEATRALTAVLRAEGDAETWDIVSLNASAGADITTAAQGVLELADGAGKLEGVFSLPQLDGRYAANLSDLWDTPTAEAELVLETLKQPLPAPADKIVVLPLTLQLQTQNNDTAIPDLAISLESANINGSAAIYPHAQSTTPLAVGELNITGLPVPLNIAARHMSAGNGHAEIRSGEALLAADYALADNLIKLQPITLDAGRDMQLRGAVTVNTDTMLAEGQLDGHIRSTTPIQQLGISAPALSAVNGKTRLILSHPKQVQHVALQYDSGKLDIGKNTLANDMKLRAEAALPADAAPHLDATVKATALATPTAWDTLTLKVSGDTEALSWHGSGTNAAEATGFDMQGELALAETLTLTLSTFTAHWQKNNMVLRKPVTLAYSANEIALSATQLRINGNADINAEARLTPAEAHGKLNISQLPLQVLPFGALSSTKGVISGKASLSGNPHNPDASLLLEIDGLQNNYPAMTRIHDEPLMASLRATLANQQFSAQLSANAPDAESFAAASLDMPVRVSLAPDALEFAMQGPIDGALKADLILGPFLPLVTPDGIYGTGHLLTDLQVSGTIEQPDIRGTVDLHSGQVEVLQTGTLIDALRFKAKAVGSRITLTEGSATDGDKGTLTFSGMVETTPNAPMDVQADFKQFVIMRHPSATATLSGDASLDGDLRDALFKGDWLINSARITIQNKGGSDVPEMRVIEVASLEEPLEKSEYADMSDEEREVAREKRRETRPFTRNLKLDVNIGAENQIFLDGFGLNAELKGKVAISGTAARPALSGQMETVRGRWDFFGRTFTITRGKAILSENNLTAPLIDIRAEAEADDVLAIAQITGTTDNPTIDFSSIPSLPKDEILARVMFGENLNSISPYQALQLADMLRSLSGDGGGSINPLSKLQNALGIDELKINNNSGNSEDVTVGVGKYVQENIYLEVEGGGAENSGKFSVEVDLTPNISVETEARQTAESAVRLNYKYDY